MGKKLVVLGAGPGGYVAAIRAAQGGADVTVVEADKVGGTCLNWGCIPSKVMKTTAEMIEKLGKASDFGIRVDGSIQPDMQRLASRKETVIKNQALGISKLLNQHDVRYVNGTGTLSKPGEIVVSPADGASITVSWDKLILATGSSPAEIPGMPFDGNDIISSNDALCLTAVPESIIIVGGGVVGCEFASIFSAFGSRVVLVEAMPRLLPLPSVDDDCSKILLREMKKRKITVLLNQTLQSVTRDPEGVKGVVGPSQFAEANAVEPSEVTAKQVLVCIGRKPGVVGTGLDQIGVGTDDRGWVTVNERMETGVKDVYAIGDVLGPSKIMLAHVASAEGIVAAENAGGGNRKMNYRAVPSAIFTSPEVAGVGLTESEARNNGCEVRADAVLFRTVGKAQVMGEIAGQAKIISSVETGEILGVHIIGPRASELIAEASLAVRLKATVADLAETIHAHPTLSEVMLETSLAAVDKPLHSK